MTDEQLLFLLRTFSNVASVALASSLLTSDSLMHLADHCPCLTRLALQNANRNFFGAESARHYGRMGHLAWLSITAAHGTSCAPASQALLDILRQLPHLKVLRVRLPSKKYEPEELLELPVLCPHLESIDLGYSVFNAETAVAVATAYGAQFQGLQLGNSLVDDEGLAEIAAQCPNLERVGLNSCKHVSIPGLTALGVHCRRLHKVMLDGLPVGNDAVRAILGPESDNPHPLWLLSLNFTRANNEALRILAARAPGLRALNAWDLDLSAPDESSSLLSLPEFLDRCPLTRLAISHPSLRSELFVGGTPETQRRGCLAAVPHVALGHCSADATDALVAAFDLAPLEANTTPVSFESVPQAWRDAVAQQWAVPLHLSERWHALPSVPWRPCLTSLLYHAPNTDALCEALARSCRETLRVLSLSNTALTDVGGVRLACLSRLTHLNVSETAVTDVTLAALAGGPQLEQLLLAKCNNVTSAGLEALLMQQPRLHALSLGSCKGLTSLAPLLQYGSALRDVDLRDVSDIDTLEHLFQIPNGQGPAVLPQLRVMRLSVMKQLAQLVNRVPKERQRGIQFSIGEMRMHRPGGSFLAEFL